MPAKVIFTSNTHPVRSLMGAKSNTIPRVARKNVFSVRHCKTRLILMQPSMGAFTRSGVSHLLPVINVVGNTALVRQKDPTHIARLKIVWSFCRSRAVSLSTFMTGNKWFISDRVNAPYYYIATIVY